MSEVRARQRQMILLKFACVTATLARKDSRWVPWVPFTCLVKLLVESSAAPGMGEKEPDAKRRRQAEEGDSIKGDIASRLQDFADGIKTLNVPRVPDSVKAELARYRCVRHGTIFESWLGDEMLIQTKFGNTNQLHLVSAPAGYRRQLTFEKEPIGETKRIPGTLWRDTEPQNFNPCGHTRSGLSR